MRILSARVGPPSDWPAMSSQPFRLSPSRRAARRALFVTLPVAALGAVALTAGAQDTSAVRRPAAATVVPAPARDSVKPAVAAAGPAAPASKPAAPATKPATAPTVVPAGAPTTSELPESDLANEYVQRAVSLYELGKDDAAIAEYRRGIAADPLDSDTWFGLADLLHELGRDTQAIETYTLALSTIEHAPELRLPFAQLLMEKHRKAEAIKVLQRGIELDPDASADMKTLLGNVVLGALDDSMAVASDSSAAAAKPAAGAPAATPAAAKARKTTTRKPRKKLCKLFCPGTLDPAAPKP